MDRRRVPAHELRHGGRVPRDEPRLRSGSSASTPAEAADPGAAAERAAAPGAQDFVLDVQLHFVRDDFTWHGILALGEFAKRWNPVLAAEGVTMHRYKFENFVKEVFLDSDTRDRHS